MSKKEDSEGNPPVLEPLTLQVDPKHFTFDALETSRYKYGGSRTLWDGYLRSSGGPNSRITLETPSEEIQNFHFSATVFNPTDNPTPEETGYVTDQQLDKILHRLESKGYVVDLQYDVDYQRYVLVRAPNGTYEKIDFGWPNETTQKEGLLKNPLFANENKRSQQPIDPERQPLKFHVYHEPTSIQTPDAGPQPNLSPGERANRMAEILKDSLNAVLMVEEPTTIKNKEIILRPII